ncbi:MAG: alanine--glyoxylate aminotransferase family protein [candidate division WOR-3 bacterium]|nr:alanine--glyoxylate aminotransferase family protein [candidate division WOR-3 bacterium]
MHKKLFIPGPTEVREDVRNVMNFPMFGHRMPETSKLMGDVAEKLQKLLYTNNFIIISTSSGTGLMEAASRNCIKNKALHFTCGAFSERWAKISKSCNKDIDTLEYEWGKGIPPEDIDEKLKTGKYDSVFVTHNETSTGVMNSLKDIGEVMKKYPDVLLCVDAVSSMAGTEIRADDWNIDFILASVQKCFALPPGLAVASVSDKAMERSAALSDKGYYFDFQVFKKYWDKAKQPPTTGALNLIVGLNYQLDKIINKEGMKNHFKRHTEMAEVVQNWARENFALFADENYLSPTVTCVKNTKGISVADLNKELGKRGAIISNGYGSLKEKTFRIAHMGEITVDEIKWLLGEINDIIG